MNTELASQLADIASSDLFTLRTLWQERYGTPPALRSVPLMRHLLAWRLQAEVYGGLDEGTRKTLARKGKVPPEGRQFGVGTRFSRLWKGEEVTVTVEENGFRVADTLYPSLSAAATAIAGSRWNGPRFFGLRGR